MTRLKGTVEHVIHRNPQNGYTVLEVSDDKGLLTCVGNLPEVQPGEPIELEGQMITHPVYGEQLSISSYALPEPEDIRALERYLGSGVIKGIGPALAARIVKRFKGDTLRVMEQEPAKLAQIKGISEKGALLMSQQVLEKRETREAMLFLGQYGISPSLSLRIYERYGSSLYSVITANPYKLMDDITHVGFRIADDIAKKVGLSPDSEYRIRSGLQYAMQQALSSGHLYLPRETLSDYASRLLEVEQSLTDKAIMDLTLDKRFVMKTVEGQTVVYLAAFYYMEAACAAMLRQLDQPMPLSEEDLDRFWRILEQSQIRLEDMQQDAVLHALERGLSVITGGPGTGKTTTISALIRYFDAMGLSVSLAAPTGRAAKRITETTGMEARTIHRLLEFTGVPQEEQDSEELRFLRNEANPLEADAIIVDEVSMVDLPLLYALLKAIIPGTRLILVGDANQLPSVGPGNVLRDIIASGTVKTTELTHIFRQAENGDIVLNAHRINRGEDFQPDKNSRDFIYLQRDNAPEVLHALVRLVRDKLPPYVKVDPYEIQVISPTRKGILGVENLNRVLQEALNPPCEEKKERAFPQGVFRQGDKVMQIKNNYQKEWTVKDRRELTLEEGSGVFNGDMGIVRDLRFFSEELVIRFDDGREAVYKFTEAEELELAYAVTVHKAQGSEYPAVVIPLLAIPQPLMTRNLIYTAVTRAKSCVCLVGLWSCFRQMVANNSREKRYSSLALQLRELYREEPSAADPYPGSP